MLHLAQSARMSCHRAEFAIFFAVVFPFMTGLSCYTGLYAQKIPVRAVVLKKPCGAKHCPFHCDAHLPTQRHARLKPLYICIYIYIYIYIYIIFLHVYMYINIYIYICMYVYMWVAAVYRFKRFTHVWTRSSVT